MTNKTLRVFISSPSDVRPERLIAEKVVQRLGREFAYHFPIEPVMWEREPLVASQHFQEGITPPRETDIVVVILWSRLGVPLPIAKFPGPLTSKAVTGTEWEFEDALKANRERKAPDLLMYRKKAPVTGSFEDEEAVQQQLAQKRLVEKFIKTWFIDQDAQSYTAAFREFVDASTFEEMLETHLRELIRKRLAKRDDVTVPAGIRWHKGSPFRGLLPFGAGACADMVRGVDRPNLDGFTKNFDRATKSKQILATRSIALAPPTRQPFRILHT